MAADPLTSRAHVAENRVVFTFEPQGWSRGVMTGYERDGGFFLEHVVAFPGAPLNTLPRMLVAGLREAEQRGYRYVALAVHRDHPFADGLTTLAKRFQFIPFHVGDDGNTHFVRYFNRGS